ncbi:hypothetical protein G7046_g4102 [Stylonectria norvegica]|nr:hypothetical protein G7046_g4102 [Stylonectria norvegica]
MVHGGTLEALQSQPGPSRRTRPPDIDIVVSEENRVPLRPEKTNRRESRLGLRNIFGRSKATKEIQIPSSPRDIPKATGIRTSIMDMSNWPYGHSAPKSESALTTAHISRPLSTMPEMPPLPNQIEEHQKLANGGKQRTGTTPGKPPRAVLGTWNPPPLFKAFPQAVKHMTLPATSLPADTILRIHERRTNGALRDEVAELTSPSTVDLSGDRLGEREKPKKKHRRNTSASAPKFDWINKIYVLVTSGYLLQYAGEGPFDRLPEKILHLSKNSAAFASDVIPGRHWVIQVSSATESNGNPAPEARSLFSRMAFRAAERRQASNFLMVFETAEDMEGWIATLRREIEILGGKKTLSETGTPKVEEEEVMQLRQQPSQRTLVVRDPERFSQIGPQQMPWRDAADQEGSVVTITDPEANNDQSLDDISTTNSVVSHDGRQLDNLRDSSNRLSFISSGQRTVVTSAGSSPESSPKADAFASHFDEKRYSDVSDQPEARPRPNAAAILDRRQSMQTMSPFVDLRAGLGNVRPLSSYGNGPLSDGGITYSPRAPTPNFSVPRSSNRRFSYVRNAPLDLGAHPQPVIEETEVFSRWTPRKAPPTTLPIARPLSMVADQPSPMEDVHERPATRHGEETELSGAADMEARSVPRIPHSYDFSSRRSSLLPLDEADMESSSPNNSRRISNAHAWRKMEETTPPARRFVSPNRHGHGPAPRMRSRPPLPSTDESYRRRSSSEFHGNNTSESGSIRSRSLRRASMQSVFSDKGSLYSISSDLPPPFAAESLPLPAPPPSMPLPPIPTMASNPHLRGDTNEKKLFSRRSLPQLSEGPPPAPPPTCALPPIPRKAPAMF